MVLKHHKTGINISPNSWIFFLNSLTTYYEKWEKKGYLKEVKLKKDLVEAIEAIEAAANRHCNNLKIRAVTVPGVPAKFLIFVSPSCKSQIERRTTINSMK